MTDAVVKILQAATPIASILAVFVTARFSLRASRDSFLREMTFAEITRRREVAVQYRKALWALAARTETVRNLARNGVRLREQGQQIKGIKFDLDDATARQAAVRDTLAELEGFTPDSIQVPARDCMEALIRSFNASLKLEVSEADAAYAFYQKRHEDLALAINEEVEHFNSIIYANSTPLWRAILGKARRKRLPYKPMSHPPELWNREERVEMK